MPRSRRKRHPPEQVARKIQSAEKILSEGSDVTALYWQLKVTGGTHNQWRNQFGGLKVENVKKLKHLGKQNLQLKTLLAEGCFYHIELARPEKRRVLASRQNRRVRNVAMLGGKLGHLTLGGQDALPFVVDVRMR